MDETGGERAPHPYDAPKLPHSEHPLRAYARALDALDAARLPYLVGGGLALATYGRERATKDLDIFIRRTDAVRAMDALTAAGFTTLETDLPWLRKAQRWGVFIDLILWSAGPIDLLPEETERAWQAEVEGLPMRVFAPEDLLLRKIYVMRDEGPDWLDALSIVERLGFRLEWSWLSRPGLDPRLLVAFLLVADARMPGVVPPRVVAEHLARLGLRPEPAAGRPALTDGSASERS